MKFCLLVLITAALIAADLIPIFSNALPEPEPKPYASTYKNSHENTITKLEKPIIEIEFLDFHHNIGVFLYLSRSPVPVPVAVTSRSRRQEDISASLYEPISALSPIRFSDEKIIFWKNRNAGWAGGGGLNLKFRLTCNAPYISKWKIETRNSHLSYNVDQLSREDESPALDGVTTLTPTDTDADNDVHFNLTRLNIFAFDREFQSGYIDCAHRGNDSIKSRLYIFQRFGGSKIEGKSFADSHDSTLVIDDFTAIPCKVHDPEVKTSIFYSQANSTHNTEIWKDVTALFSYDWKSGFSSRNGSFQYKSGQRFKCTIVGNESYVPDVTYTLVAGTGTGIRTGGERSLPKSNGPNTVQLGHELLQKRNQRTFVCKLGHNDENQNADRYFSAVVQIQLEFCSTLDICLPNPDQNPDSGIKRNSDKFLENNFRMTNINSEKSCQSTECELQLPRVISGHVSFGVHPQQQNSNELGIHFQGRLLCKAGMREEEQRSEDHYFTGLSGKLYLLSQPTPPEEIIQLKIEAQSLNTITVSCSAVKFLTFRSFKFSVSFINGNERYIAQNEYTTNVGSNGNPNQHHYEEEPWKESRTVTVNKFLVNGLGGFQLKLKSISCHVPPYNSKQWLKSTQNIPEFPAKSVTNDAENLENEPKKEEGNTLNTSTITVISSLAVIWILLIFICVWCFHQHCTIECCCCPPNQTDVVTCEVIPSPELNLKKSLKRQRSVPSKFLISKNDITPDEDRVLAEGQFSKLCQGYLKHRYRGRNDVNLKTNKVAGDPEQIAALLNDAQIRILIGQQQHHHNIVSFHGMYFDSIEGKVYIAMNPEHTGSIRDYMASGSGREKLLNTCPSKRTLNLITWLRGVANGMEFLHGLKVIHGNLATENILLFPNNSVKITGFSHSEQLPTNIGYYVKGRSWCWDSSGWKWMPMESLRYMEFSKESDIWSFGVTMWEIFSLGSSPYMDQGYFHFSMDFVIQLEHGLRLYQPQLASPLIYKRMTECWSRFGRDRPTFNALNHKLDDMLSQLRYENV